MKISTLPHLVVLYLLVGVLFDDEEPFYRFAIVRCHDSEVLVVLQAGLITCQDYELAEGQNNINIDGISLK
jgi:hypothetical protein